MIDPADATLAAYQSGAEQYRQASAPPSAEMIRFLDRVADLVARGTVLEIGSGPGWDADHLESRGVRVVRTDATQAFVDGLRAAGHDAQLLDVRTDPLGGPWDAIMANAVLLHLDRPTFADVLVRARTAVREGGVLAYTVKEGDGSGWNEAKLPRPRHETYWRADAVREVLTTTGWRLLSCDHVSGRTDPWLFVLAHASGLVSGRRDSPPAR